MCGPLGGPLGGVRGISFEEGNEVIGMATITPDSRTSILTVTELGYGKRTQCTEYRVQARAGKGIISVKMTEKNGPAISFHQVGDADEVMIMTAEGMVLRLRMGDLREIGRNAQGVRLMDMGETDRVVGVAKLADPESPPTTGNENNGNPLPLDDSVSSLDAE